ALLKRHLRVNGNDQVEFLERGSPEVRHRRFVMLSGPLLKQQLASRAVRLFGVRRVQFHEPAESLLFAKQEEGLAIIPRQVGKSRAGRVGVSVKAGHVADKGNTVDMAEAIAGCVEATT